MIKRIILAIAIIVGSLLPVNAAGTITLSLSQQFDSLGNPLNGGLLYFYAAGTTTPQSAYQDTALTIAHPNPITLDSAGRVPQFFLADGSIKIRLTNSAGVVQIAADGILVIGASSGGGGGSPVDATTILATGDLKVKYGTGALTGFVRANGRTIGSATSGASERANADCQALFEYLWTADANLTVSTGRGASANADWVANKTIALPDWRGRALAGLDDMGNSAAGRLTATYFGTAATVLGAAGGAESHTLITAEIPSHTHTANVTDPGHVHTPLSPFTQFVANSAGTNAIGGTGVTGSVSTTASATTGITVANTNTGDGGAHKNVQPTMLATVYLKL
jgi:microcystin-dependent protein